MKVKIINADNQYLQGFNPNENYAKQARAIQSNLHMLSEYNSVWGDAEKTFDPITAKGYIATLIEEVRWSKNRINFNVVFEEGRQ